MPIFPSASRLNSFRAWRNKRRTFSIFHWFHSCCAENPIFVQTIGLDLREEISQHFWIYIFPKPCFYPVEIEKRNIPVTACWAILSISKYSRIPFSLTCPVYSTSVCANALIAASAWIIPGVHIVKLRLRHLHNTGRGVNGQVSERYSGIFGDAQYCSNMPLPEYFVSRFSTG